MDNAAKKLYGWLKIGTNHEEETNQMDKINATTFNMVTEIPQNIHLISEHKVQCFTIIYVLSTPSLALQNSYKTTGNN